ncbi:KH domain RNA binding protein, vigilin [Schizosaccharomyces osmophilus]|uniref:KH domain RNA binding protein, vigilin n=1 Tax=Schizosaccharomyces osmophilus TaxID=2545709 RepID=A0AAE9WFM6_9SCHI|nr:KH domain RNA binding protein, vigilin [Schizosaccharomyces osmophilus]WBW75025.1 KH domain RNA binding protein, vigilin [Schizosaccharomyces osmophilus]
MENLFTSEQFTMTTNNIEATNASSGFPAAGNEDLKVQYDGSLASNVSEISGVKHETLDNATAAVPSQEETENLPPSALLQKKHAVENHSKPASLRSTSQKPAVDVHSEAAFPTLSPKVNTNKPKNPSWVRKAAGVGSAANDDTASSANSPTSSSRTASTSKETDYMTDTLILGPDQQISRLSFTGKPNSVADIVRTIMLQTSTRINVSTASKTKNTTFLIQGKVASVKAAHRQIIRSIGRRNTIIVPCPVFVVGAVIGSNGQNLKTIMDRTGTRIQIPKRNSSAADDNDSFTKNEKSTLSSPTSLDEMEPQYDLTSVTIEGDFEGAELAKKEIESIINERTSHTTIRINTIPTDLYNLLRGADGSNIAEYEQGKDLKVQIPFAYSDSNLPVNPIVLFGEKSCVRECALFLQGKAEELARTTIPTMIPVPRRQHRFINGEKSAGIQDILRSTGCSVILPPINSESDIVSVRGPAMNISDGIKMTMERANSTVIDAVNVSNVFTSLKDPFSHANLLARFFIRSKFLSQYENALKVQFHLPKREELQEPTNKSVIVEISSKDGENVLNARATLIKIIGQFPPHKFYNVEIDPLLQRYVIGSKGKNLQKLRADHSVELLIGDNGEDDSSVILCFTGSADEKLPEQIQEELATLGERIKSSADASAKIVSETFQVPSVYHKHIVGPKGTTLKAILGNSEENVIVQLGKVSYRSDSTDDDVYVRGFSNDVQRITNEIKQLVRDAKNHEILHSYVAEFNFPAQYSKNIIGKNGSNVSTLREDFGVQINVEEGQVRIQGIKKNVEETKSRIEAQVQALMDDTIIRVTIPNEFHRQLIGASGKYVKRLEEKFTVRVRFPREDDLSATGGEATKPSSADEIVIRGSKKAVASAKQELIELYEYEKSIAYSEAIEIPSKAASRIVGRNGATVEKIRAQHDVKIDIGDERSEGAINVSVRGSKENVQGAIQEIKVIADEIKNQVEKVVKIDREYHRFLIGPSGSNLQEIIKECGGTADKAETARLVSFSNGSSDEDRNSVVLRGNKQLVEALESRFLQIVEELKNQVEKTVDVPQRSISSIIGRMGSSRRDIEKKTSTSLTIPNVLDPEQLVKITIIGSPENCDKAIKMIQEKVASQYAETLEVSNILCERLTNGPFIRRLRNDLKVFVDVPGVNKQLEGSEVVLEDNEEGPYPWKLVTKQKNTDGSSTLTIRGHKENVEKAITALEKSLKQLEEECTGYLSVPPNLHRHIIGAGGSAINKIRKAAQVKIDVPRTPGVDIIVIQGSHSGAAKAKDLIIERLSESQD